MTVKEDKSLNDPAKPHAPKVESKQDHYQAIRGHIAELTKTGDQTLKNALGKIIVRLDRIEGKSA